MFKFENDPYLVICCQGAITDDCEAFIFLNEKIIRLTIDGDDGVKVGDEFVVYKTVGDDDYTHLVTIGNDSVIVLHFAIIEDEHIEIIQTESFTRTLN